MLHEATQKLIGGKRHGALPTAVSIVFPTKSNCGVGDRDQAVVGDGDPMGVASQIVEDMLGSAERRLGVDDPLLPEHSAQKLAEVFLFAQRQALTQEAQLVVAKSTAQSRDEFTAEDTAENFDGQ